MSGKNKSFDCSNNLIQVESIFPDKYTAHKQTLEYKKAIYEKHLRDIKCLILANIGINFCVECQLFETSDFNSVSYFSSLGYDIIKLDNPEIQNLYRISWE